MIVTPGLKAPILLLSSLHRNIWKFTDFVITLNNRGYCGVQNCSIMCSGWFDKISGMGKKKHHGTIMTTKGVSNGSAPHRPIIWIWVI